MQTSTISTSSKSNGFNQTITNKALEISGIAIWEYNLLTQLGQCNENWYKLFGYAKDEISITPSDFYKIIHPEDALLLSKELSKYHSSNSSEVLEIQFRLKTKNNEWKWVRSRSVLEFDHTNQPTKWVGSIMEISRLKNTEGKALLNNIHLNSVVNSLSDIVFEIDNEYTFINCWIPENNPYSEKVKSFKGKKIVDVYGKTIFGYFKSVVDNTYITKEKQEFHYFAKRSRKHYLAKTTLLPQRPNQPQHITMVIQDVTEIKETQIELEQKESNLNAIIQNTSDVFWAIDKDEFIMVYNKSFEDMYFDLSGKNPEIGGRLDDSFLNEETAKRWRLIHSRSLDGKNTEFSKHVYFTDGRVRLYEFHINPFKNKEGEIIGSVVTGRDIDDIYTAKKQAEKAARSKSKFVSTISHEMRTPLNAIINTCHQLEQINLQKNMIEDINILHLASENLLSLINDVLDFTKLDSGKSVIKVSQFNLKYFLDGVSQFSSNLAKSKGLDFNSSIADSIPEFINADKTKLHQVLTNLLSNGIKYTDKGQVEFNVTADQITETKALISFNITDTGIGIPDSDIHDIFDSFTQSSTSYSMLKGGTGLGLAITKNLVSLLGGNITVESQINKGSVFNFELEVELPKKKDLSLNQPIVKSNLNGLKILIAEDNEINAKIITRLLGQWGAEFDLANNGVEAVNLAKANAYNLILMDIQMPLKNGFEASSDIISDVTGLNNCTPILALTAQPDFSFDPSYKEGVFHGYILKPFHPDNLKKRIISEAISLDRTLQQSS